MRHLRPALCLALHRKHAAGMPAYLMAAGAAYGEQPRKPIGDDAGGYQALTIVLAIRRQARRQPAQALARRQAFSPTRRRDLLIRQRRGGSEWLPVAHSQWPHSTLMPNTTEIWQ